MVSTFTFSIFPWLCPCFLPKVLDFNFDASISLSVRHLSVSSSFVCLKFFNFWMLSSKICKVFNDILDYCSPWLEKDSYKYWGQKVKITFVSCLKWFQLPIKLLLTNGSSSPENQFFAVTFKTFIFTQIPKIKIRINF